MASESGKIYIKNDLSITDINFNIMSNELLHGDFFNYVQKFNNDIIIDCKNNNGIIHLYIKNIVDKFDDEITLIRFSYSCEKIENTFHIKCFSVDECENEENEDYFCVDFDNFSLEIERNKFQFLMIHNPKKYPHCVFIMIRKYFEIIFENMKNSICVDF